MRFHATEIYLDLRLVNRCITFIKLYQDLFEEILTFSSSRYPKKHLSPGLTRERRMFSLSLQKLLSTLKAKDHHRFNQIVLADTR